MTKYVLWDIPTSTMLLDTGNVEEARRSIDAFIQDNDISVLDELLLGIEEPEEDTARSYTGRAILSELDALRKERVR